MIIYKVTFPNGKIYIGQTQKTFNQRKALHIWQSKKVKNKISSIGQIIAINYKTQEVIGIFDSISDCSRKLNLNIGHISSILKNRPGIKTHKGLVFRKYNVPKS